MAESTGTIVDLDSLNKKQLAKEFKATVKDIKAKDPAKKRDALEKFKNPRYFLEGGCFIPFVHSLVPKPKTLDFTADALTSLVTFLKLRPNDESTSLLSMVNVYTETGSLECLQCVADIMVYKEEVKKKKKKEEVPPPDIIGDNIRSLSLQAMYLFAKALTETECDSNLIIEFGNIPSIVQHLTRVIHTLNSACLDNTAAVDDISFALDILLLIVSHDSSKIEVMLSSDTFLDTVAHLLDEKSLQLKSLRLFHVLTEHSDGLPLIATADNISRIVDKLEASCQKTTSDPAGGKGKGKNALDLPPDRIAILKSELSITYTAIKALIVLSANAKESIEAEIAKRVVECVSPVLLNADVRRVTSEAQHGYVETSLTYFFRDAAILFGQFGLISDDICSSACSSGAVLTLLKCLKSARLIMGQEVPEEVVKSARQITEEVKLEPLGHDFDVLRHVLEKAVLHLISHEREQCGSARWHSCEHYALHDSHITRTFEADPQSALTFIIDMLGSTDGDLVYRCVRLLAAILQSVDDPLQFLRTQKANTSAMTKLCAVISSTAAEVAKSMEAKREEEQSNDAENDKSVVAIVTPLPSPTSTFCLSLTCLEYLLPEQETLISFCTNDRMAQIAAVLYLCGPKASNKQIVEEVYEPIYDPRRFSWDYMKLASHLDDAIYPREVAFDVLSIISLAEPKYRTFDGALPQEPNTPFPESTNPCATHISYAFQHCANPCVSAILYCSEYSLCCDHVGVVPKDSGLVTPVLDSALRYLASIAAAGMPGLSVLFTSISALAFGPSTPSTPSAVASLKAFLSQVILPALSAEDADKLREELQNQTADTKVPTLFVLPRNEKVFTFVDEVVRNSSTWVCISILSSVTGVLANPAYNATTLKFALDALVSLCRNRNMKDEIQPALVDMFSATFLALGGSIMLSGCIGRFGVLRDCIEGVTFLKYLINRGNCREVYWRDWATAQAENADTNKKKDTKKPPEKRKGDAETLRLPFEPDDTHPDPNHGPDGAFWQEIINVACDDLHARCRVSRPLIASVFGNLHEITTALLSAGASVNASGEFGCTALMYALLLSDKEAVQGLIAAGADIDLLDDQRNPTVKYAIFVPSSESLEEIFTEVRSGTVHEQCNISGLPTHLDVLLDAGVDLGVCDADGNYPLHWALGNGSLLVHADGVAFTVTSNVYTASSTYATLQDLLAKKTSVNISNRERVTPLHIATARGDINATRLLLQHGAYANVLDASGYLPLHYLAAVCPENCLELLTLLMDKGVRRPLYHLDFVDERTGKSKEEKYDVDAERILDHMLSTALIPDIAKQKRMAINDILLSRTLTGISILQLALVGSYLRDEIYDAYLNTNTTVESRLNFAMTLLRLATGDTVREMLHSVDSRNFTCLHALSLLCEDVAINPDFIKLFSLITADGGSGNYLTTRRVKKDVPAAWTPLHGAIATSAPSSIISILLNVLSLADHTYGHFVASIPSVAADVLTTIVDAALANQQHTVLLNSAVDGLRPLHVAVECKNTTFIECMATTPQADFNAVDEVTGRSPFHNACANGDDEVIASFEPAMERIDLLLEDAEGSTVVDSVVRALNVKRVRYLLQKRKNDVMERALLVKEGGAALLQELEFSNIELADQIAALSSENADEAAGTPTLTAVSELLQHNEEVLQLLLETLKDLGDVVTSDFHCNPCFAEGIVYSQRPTTTSNQEILEPVDDAVVQEVAIEEDENSLPAAQQDEVHE